MIKNVKLPELNTNIAITFMNTQVQKKFDETLKKSFIDTYKFSHQDIKKFILLLRKGDYPYEYMDDWKKFNEISLPEKEDFYSHLNIEDITNEDYMHEKGF